MPPKPPPVPLASRPTTRGQSGLPRRSWAGMARTHRASTPKGTPVADPPADSFPSLPAAASSLSPEIVANLSRSIAVLIQQATTSSQPATAAPSFVPASQMAREPAPSSSDSSSSSSSSSSSDDERGLGASSSADRRKERKRKRKAKRRRQMARFAGSEQPAVAGGPRPNVPCWRDGFWVDHALVPGLPRWHSGLQGVWVDPQMNDLPICAPGEHPPGAHLSSKVRKLILRGCYVDVFTLLQPKGKEAIAVTSTKKAKKEPKVAPAEHTFANWLEGFTIFKAVVSMAFPERAWHLDGHLLNVLRAKAFAGDTAAIAYDAAFRQHASQNSRERWDLLHNEIWLLEVGTRAAPRALSQVSSQFADKGLLCWDFNVGKCIRTQCKFDHLCAFCRGSHARLSCPDALSSSQFSRARRPASPINPGVGLASK
ncbi:uncharacterized protein LOC121929400 [Sceloporus undulatus]|uniref:uncharacterized protein LOC121929400 n=1 Tax=Sceloporus undulatus TaxID=8520 RepID=UPI001C4D32CB|nr:uncharacterized protein LOC121929400 [Sceloporus undulatus]